MAGSLTVVSGFSGAGKGTIMKALLQRYDSYVLSISCTTRPRRDYEEDGREYFFITQEEFDRKVANDELLEHAGYVNHCYGTPRAFVEDQIAQGKDVLLEIEVQGAAIVKEKCPDAIMIFVVPPSADVLRERLIGRGTDSADAIRNRLWQASREINEIEKYDALVINDDLDAAVEMVHMTIQTEKNAPSRQTAFLRSLRRDLDDLNRRFKNF